MSDSISTARALIDDRLDELHALLTDDPVDVVTGRYQAWRAAARASLQGVVSEAALARFDAARGVAPPGAGGRPTPPVYLDGAASRDCLLALKQELEADPAALLVEPPKGPGPTHPSREIIKLVDLLTRRLPFAFRGGPETERDLQNGFETLLAGAGVVYEREEGRVRAFAPHFTFPELGTALQLKLCDREDRPAGIRAEIRDEIDACRSRFEHIVFGVFDLGFIPEPDAFARAFEARDRVWVRVIRPPNLAGSRRTR
ncbi:MAG: hypothetical protein K1Y01_05405 [Vicinamibacteria bacterium]|nr:hypothetical protein [Vicinamibacteria bacterium]